MVGILLAEKRQEIQGEVATRHGRLRRGPKAILGHAAQDLGREAAVPRMEGDAAARQGIVKTQFTVLPGTEDEAAAQLFEERAGPHLQEIGIQGGIQARKAEAFQFGRVAGQGFRIILGLEPGGEKALQIVQFQIVVGTPGMGRGPDDVVIQIVDGVRFQAAGELPPVLG